MLRLFIFVIVGLSLTLRARGVHFVPSEDFQTAYALLLDLKFDDAQRRIAKIKVSDPENVGVYYLEDLSDFLYIVVTEDQIEFERRKENRSQRLKLFEQLPENSPYKYLAQGEIHLHWAFSMMRFGEYLSGAREINKAFHLLEKNMKAHPDFLPTYKGMGLLHTLVGTVPDNYRWATKLMGVDGTIDKGIAEMEMVIKRSEGKSEHRNLRKETCFLLSFLHINLLNDATGLQNISETIDSEKGPLMVFANASLLRKAAKTDEAIAILESDPVSRKAFPYLEFLLGELKLSRMDADASLPFRQYIRSFKGKSYLKSAYQKMAWHALITSGDVTTYRTIISKVNEVGSSMLDEDKAAQKEFEQGELPNKTLLKARLQFDGGFYENALATLVKSPTGSIRTAEEQLEFTYRLGRIHHEMGNLKQAIDYYQLTIAKGASSKRYYAANSSLMLGLIYEKTNQTDLAIKAFKACSTFENAEYRNSINQKAKAGILRLKR
ncbi:MAG: tetratricopeptide repeat protein [Bacteroidetes bacterium]|nr:MAG: tetratricopeptide repeat protein [Bacteroidota bacterium]